MTSIPDLFRCPISLDLFTDPVTLSTGQTYDRSGIEKWIASGNLTCPVTMQKLLDPTLVPNHTLRHLIDQWLLSGNRSNTQKENPLRPLHNEGEGETPLSTLKHNLCSKDGTFESKMKTLRKIRILYLESSTGRHCLIHLGFFPLLLELVFQSPLQELELVEVALDCLLSLSPSTQLASLNMMKERSNLSAMIDLLDHGNIKIRTGLCCLIEIATTTTSLMVEDLCFQICHEAQVLQILVSLLSSVTPESEASVRAISVLCSHESNRHIAINEGVIDGIITYLSFPSRCNVGRALSTMEALLVEETGRKALIRNPMGVKVLVKMVFRVSTKDDDGSEHAIGSLLVICGISKVARMEAVNIGLLSQLLLLLQSQCGFMAKGKARALLKLLRSMWDED